MLVGLVCSCANVETMVRSAFKNAGKPDWVSRMIYHGKTGAEVWWRQLPDEYKNEDTELLKYYIDTHSKYAIIFGADDNGTMWGDIADSSPTGKLRAEVVAEQFD